MSATVKAMCDRLVRDRQEELLAAPETRDRFAAYLDGLARDYAGDPAMAAYVRSSRALLAERIEEGR
ncbi:hypothetical protein [Actinomadura nitritigenes]|uniref:hypothetical protein n=1 Tax=Actinomadura nitritigenes TaxID=134602 RepID=UPI003D8A1FF5